MFSLCQKRKGGDDDGLINDDDSDDGKPKKKRGRPKQQSESEYDSDGNPIKKTKKKKERKRKLVQHFIYVSCILSILLRDAMKCIELHVMLPKTKLSMSMH